MSKILRRTTPTEHQIQSAIVEWARNTTIPDTLLKIGDLLIKIPNEGKRSYATAKYMKKEGMMKGVSDLFLARRAKRKKFVPLLGDFYSGLWIEVKTAKGKLTRDQRIFLTNMYLQGYQAIVVRTPDQGIKEIKNYLGMA